MTSQNTLSTADLCDEYRDIVEVIDVPLTSFGGLRQCFGPVRTIRVKENVIPIREILEQDGAESILIIDTDSDLEHAVFGDNLGMQALKNNWAGIVVIGCVRDTRILMDLSIGVWALGTCPQRGWETPEPQLDVPVQIGACTVNPGDYLYCDEDGVITSPNCLIK